MYSSTLLTVLGSVAFTQANPLLSRDGAVAGVATFNDYATQFAASGTVCGIAKPANQAYFGAAASDISADISGGSCDGTIQGDQRAAGYDMNLCNMGNIPQPIDGYMGPSCPKNNCPDQNPTCYRVDNLGPIKPAGQTPPLGSPVIGTVTVQIIDACPAGSAWNYCKDNTDIDPRQRCASVGTNELDIDQPAYQQLTGQAWSAGGSPNLDIQITKVPC